MRIGDDDVWVFERARPGDGSHMQRLARSAYRLYVERIGREPAPMASDYAAIAAAGDAVLARDQGAVVGMLVFRLEPNSVLVENLAVSPELQGSGLGTALLEEADRIARSSGKREVRLYTNEAMVENLSFYPRRGFRETHRAVEHGFARVYFAKQIAV